jgi:hypothetical protein
MDSAGKGISWWWVLATGSEMLRNAGGSAATRGTRAKNAVENFMLSEDGDVERLDLECSTVQLLY